MKESSDIRTKDIGAVPLRIYIETKQIPHIQRQHVYPKLKRRGNDCFTSFQRGIHVVCLNLCDNHTNEKGTVPLRK